MDRVTGLVVPHEQPAESVPDGGPTLWSAARRARARAAERRSVVRSWRASDDASPGRRVVVQDYRTAQLELRQERAANTALRAHVAQLIHRLAEAEAEIAASHAELRAMNREVQQYVARLSGSGPDGEDGAGSRGVEPGEQSPDGSRQSVL